MSSWKYLLQHWTFLFNFSSGGQRKMIYAILMFQQRGAFTLMGKKPRVFWTKWLRFPRNFSLPEWRIMWNAEATGGILVAQTLQDAGLDSCRSKAKYCLFVIPMPKRSYNASHKLSACQQVSENWRIRRNDPYLQRFNCNHRLPWGW